MASLREYYDADFNYAARLHVRVPNEEFSDIEGAVLYDFSANTAFFACFVPGADREAGYFRKLLTSLKFGESQVTFDGKVTLPSGRAFPGRLKITNSAPLEILAQFHGDPEWLSISQVRGSNRIFIYSETQLGESDILVLKVDAQEVGQSLQFRSLDHARERSKNEVPLAFVSHDTRDKATIARPIAIGLQRLMCPVWYDEFSLKVGSNLRESIERGLKECKKCVLVLSQNFLGNGGWTKKEFETIFTREILEEQQLVLPVWHDVTKHQVYDYCPSLLNVKGISWTDLGEAEVCRQLANSILDQRL